MTTLADRRARFRALHAAHGCFVMPNPHDIGGAVLLERLGFAAIATTSAGHAFTLARRDGAVGRDEALAHAAMLVAATSVPVNGDLENGYGDAPEAVAETVRGAIEAGLAGCSIEDAKRDQGVAFYPLEEAVARIRAASQARGGTPDFVLTARAEQPIAGRRDLDDVIARLKAFRSAGADVVYAPALARAADIARAVAEVASPFNVLAGRPGFALSATDLAALGVRRMSIGSGLSRAAFGVMHDIARRLRDSGRFELPGRIDGYGSFDALFAEDAPAR